MRCIRITRSIRAWPEWIKSLLHGFRLLALGRPGQAQWPLRVFILQLGGLLRNGFSSRLERECLACGWKGFRFLPDWNRDGIVQDTVCPWCGSFSRYHLYFYWLRGLLSRQNGEYRYAHILEVAPKPCSTRFFKRVAPKSTYFTCDLNSSLAMSFHDIRSLGFTDEIFHVVLCSHVLEHVLDDITAMNELYRVIRRGGLAIIQVPVDWSLTKTQEYFKPRNDEDGHVRQYGQDYPERLMSAGFRVDIFDVDEKLTPEAQVRHGIKSNRLVIAFKD